MTLPAPAANQRRYLPTSIHEYCRATEFAQTATLTGAPGGVAEQVRVRTLDTLAAATAGSRTPTVDITRDYAWESLEGDAATLLDGSGARCSVAGTTLVNATAANALNIDGGHRAVKGHPAAVVVPPALAAAEAVGDTVGEFLNAVYVGYELAVRAGLAIHATDDVYTGTGSWGGVGAAAAVARLQDLSPAATARSLGIAEYHAPRTPIMRGVERPGMTKDGIGWGASAGTVAVDLASLGFTASGTVFDEASVAVTDDLGERRHVTEGYLKPYPCCRWAHPGVDAALPLRERHGITAKDIETVRIHTFSEATHLDTREPDSIESAEYSYPYPVAAALVRGQFTPGELREPARNSEEILRLADAVHLDVDGTLDDRFPVECLARVELDAGDETYRSGVTRPRGAVDRPLDATEARRKTECLCRPTLDGSAVEQVRSALSDRSAPIGNVTSQWR